MSQMLITLPSGISIGFEQMVFINQQLNKYGSDLVSWHPNQCGCCITVHTPEYDYVVDRDGGYDTFLPEGSPLMKSIDILDRDVNGRVLTASVADSLTPAVAVVVERTPDGDWLPLYALKRSERIALPNCFNLSRESRVALDEAAGVRPQHHDIRSSDLDLRAGP